jgi:hypothetical protein
MASYRKRGNIWYYRFKDHTGRQVERKGHWNRATTKALARRSEDETARIRAGLLPPPEATTQKSVPAQTLREHVDSYIRHLNHKGKDPKYVAQTKNYINRIVDYCGVESPTDLTPDGVLSALDSLRNQNLSARTLNAHLTAIKALSHWICTFRD